MIPVSQLATNLVCRLGEVTNHSFILPLLIFYPTSRCNSRCISCDWWRSTGEDDLTLEEIATMVRLLAGWGTRTVAFSGGEPLCRDEVFEIASLFRAGGMKLHLLTSGVLLHKFATEIATTFERVTLSLDGSTAASYHAVRGVAGLVPIETGVTKLKKIAPRLPVTARATLHAANYRELPHLVAKAKALGLDGISFLAADVSSNAFGHPGSRKDQGLLLSVDQIAEFSAIIDETVRDHAEDFASGFIAEHPDKLRRLPQYYAAMQGHGTFGPVSCNAPWVSAVIEANGNVRPCYFHQPVGNVRTKSLAKILQDDLPAFRRTLDVSAHPVCERCVCSLRVSLTSRPW